MTNDKGKIITPNNGKDRKVVGIDNKPLNSDIGKVPHKPLDGITNESSNKDKIIAAIRDLAMRLEDGTLPEPEFLILIPKFKQGDTSLMYFGEPVPTVLVEGTIHKVLTRMAMS